MSQHSLAGHSKSPSKASMKRAASGSSFPAQKPRLNPQTSLMKRPPEQTSLARRPRSNSRAQGAQGVQGSQGLQGIHAKSGAHTNPSMPTKQASQFKPNPQAKPNPQPKPGTQTKRSPAQLLDKDFLKEKLLTRRNFLIGAGGIAAAAAIAFGVDASKKATQQAESDAIKAVAGDAAGASSTSGDLSILSVPQDAVFTTENCEYIDNSDSVLNLRTTVSLPHGTLIWANDDSVAACLLPTETSSPLTQIGILSLGNGNLTTALSKPVSGDEGFQIYDVRANSIGAVWVESDILNGYWRVYHSELSGNTIASPVLVAEGNDDWDMPSIAICGGYSFWQITPNQVKNKNVSSAKLKSTLMRAPIGAPIENAEAVYEAKGYMACAPSGTATGVAIAPRADASGVYYQLTHIDAESGEVTDSITLPASMKPSEICYGQTGFSFSFDGIYQYGDGIANLGTYTPVTPVALTTQAAIENAELAIRDSLPTEKDGSIRELNESEIESAAKRGISAVADLYSASEWFRFPRTPLTTPSWCGSWFLVKSTNVVAGIDLVGKRYFTLQASGNGENYGEFLASSGTMNRIVTYANLDYTPINGEPIKECQVRIWTIG